ncbi:MAG: hypothetical protein NC342_00460 [Pseudoflavonifractor sp.]|nr:hypothetical protein [Alloprevotella sp.]MCM1115998.1 hypothetical protein [Pseudoflavonifractor sp.]
MLRKIAIIILSIFTSMSCIAQFKEVIVGDILNINGIKGIVFCVNDDGTHGQIMSVKAFRAKKDLFCIKSSLLKGLSMTDENDGMQNTQNLFNFCVEHNIPITSFPVFNWCKSLGHGWYIPSVNQLKDFVNYWLGNTNVEVQWDDEDEPIEEQDNSISHTKVVDNILLNAGGIPFLNGVFSSTLNEDRKVDVFQYKKDDGKWSFKKENPMKIDAFCVGRAFYDF